MDGFDKVTWFKNVINSYVKESEEYIRVLKDGIP
jgi:hypothetical protein